MKKILTVVIPSYNVEKYLNQTLDSFIDERILGEIEVFIVDDGSKDRTAEIGKAYEEQYPGSFYVVTKENGGHGSTINKGIELGTGKYFKVVDGDDWVQTEDFVKLVQMLRECEEDYIVTNYYEVHDITGEKNSKSFGYIPENKSVGFKDIAEKGILPMHALVIRTEILKENGIRLDEHCFYVDVEYILYPIPYVETVRYLNLYVYMYRLSVVTQSVSIQGFQRHIQNHIDVILHLLDFLEQYISKGSEQYKRDYIEKRIAMMIDDQTTIFLSFPKNDKEMRLRFHEFDDVVREKNKEVHELSGTYRKVLRLLRKTKFRYFTIIVTLSNIRNHK